MLQIKLVRRRRPDIASASNAAIAMIHPSLYDLGTPRYDQFRQPDEARYRADDSAEIQLDDANAGIAHVFGMGLRGQQAHHDHRVGQPRLGGDEPG